MINVNKFHLTEVNNFIGFVVETVRKGEMAKVLTRATIISDQIEFYTYIDQISTQFLAKIGIFVNAIYQFLIIIHNDLSADIYVNDFPIILEILTKKSVDKGQLIMHRDIADIRKLQFEGIDIQDTDKIVYCFKVGWKFGLFFDLARNISKLNIDKMYLTLGELYRYLSFQYIYNILESEKEFEEMMKDGWFPFIELIGTEEYKFLLQIYREKRDTEDIIEEFIGNFDNKRIDNLINKWWSKDIFKEKEIIIRAGINAFLRHDDEGYINCIKTLFPEIEGIIRIQYFRETSKSKNVKFNHLIEYLVTKGKDKTGSNYSLFLPMPFLRYLNEYVFANFDLKDGRITLSRHTSSHGIAAAEQYTKIKALQMILILDQIYFYI